MELTLESNDLNGYLIELEEVNYSHPDIQHVINDLNSNSQSIVDYITRAFEFVRDDISHSWDIQGTQVTRQASEVLHFREGICYAKSNLLAALLRGRGIPTGFCYQKLTLGDTPDTGYCIHALNAVYVEGRWIRLDARGNKPGVDAQFSLDGEKLAFPIRQQYGELDYPTIYTRPNSKTMTVLQQNTDVREMCLFRLPTDLYGIDGELVNKSSK